MLTKFSGRRKPGKRNIGHFAETDSGNRKHQLKARERQNEGTDKTQTHRYTPDVRETALTLHRPTSGVHITAILD